MAYTMKDLKAVRRMNRVPSLFGCDPEPEPKTKANSFDAAIRWRNRLLAKVPGL